MAYTDTQLTALQNALASGELSVSYDGKSTTYRSVAEIKSAIAEVKAGLAVTSGAKLYKQIRFRTSKGF